jgi:hypothetical protein
MNLNDKIINFERQNRMNEFDHVLGFDEMMDEVKQ